MMNRILSSLIFIFLIAATGYSQSWKWAKAGGGTQNDMATDVLVDDEDNLFACGTYSSLATFDGQTISGGNSFLIKYDSSGVKQWVYSFPGDLLRLSVDPNNSNNLLAAGIYSGTISIGSTTLVSNGLNDVFAFKFDQSGNISWATSWGGAASDELQDIEYQVSSEIIATGTFKSPVIFFNDGISLNQTYDASQTNGRTAANLYLVKLKNTDGKALTAYTNGVSTDTYAATLIFETDMRGNAGISIQKGSFNTSGFGSIVPGPIIYGSTTISRPYAVLQLDSTLQLRKILLTDTSYRNNFDQLTIERTSSHLDRNSVYYLHRAQDYLDVGGQSVGSRGHFESVTPVNLAKETTFSGAGYETGTCCDAPPMLIPFGLYDNKLAYRLGNGPTGIQAFSLVFTSSFSKAHPSAFNASKHLMNNAGNKVYISGSYSGGSNTLDGISLQGLGGTDAYFAVLQLPAKPLRADAGLDRVKCSGNNTGVNIGGYPSAIGGSGTPYSYSWSPATGLNDPNLPYPLANPSVNTEYILTVTDGTGQVAKDTVIVFVNQLIATIAPAGSVGICQNGNVVLTANGSGTYLWSNGATSRSITVGAAGTYSVTIVDECGNASTSAPVTVTVNALPSTPVVTASGPLTICTGSAVTLTAPAGYTYLWNNGATTQSITVDSAFNYRVIVTNANGCVAQSANNVNTVTLWSPTIVPTITYASSSFCEGSTRSLTAPAGYNYLWNTGAVTRTLAASTGGSYTVTISSPAANCGAPQTSAPVLLTMNPRPPVPVITANGPLDYCNGDSVLLSAPPGYDNYRWTGTYCCLSGPQSIMAYGTTHNQVEVYYATGCYNTSAIVRTTTGTPPPVPTITANGPTTFCQGGAVTLTVHTGVINYLWSNGATTNSTAITTSGIYNVRVFNGGCGTASLPVTVTVDPLPSIPTITASGPTTICTGGSVVLSAPAGFTYVWNTGATSQSINVSTAGNYSVTVTNANSCSAVSAVTTVIVNSNPPVPTITASGPATFCQGGSVTLTAPAGFSYLWSSGATTQSINVSAGGNYSVTVTNTSNCSAGSATVPVTVNPLPPTPAITASGPATFCQGGSVTLTAPSGFNYLWSNGATTQNINVTTSGNYSVTVTNTNNCSATSAVTTVTVNSLPATPVITASGPTTFCQGGSVTLTAPAGFTYLWSNGATSQSINVNTSGSYSVTISNANNCLATSAATSVTVNPLPAIPVITAGGPTTFCLGGSVTLTAPAGFNYLWSNGSASQSINTSSTGSFSVIVTNANNCSAGSATTNVIVNSLPATPTISVGGPLTFCQGGSVTLTAPAGFTYLWSTGATTQNISVNASGNYSVTVWNANNCSATSAAATITVNPLPVTPVITAGGPTSFCQGGSVTLTAPAGFSYGWSNGATTQSIQVSSSGIYSVTVTNANNCSASSAATTVTVNGLPPVPVITQTGNTLSSSSTSGNQWYLNGTQIAGATGSSYTYTVGGNYSVTVTNTAGCSSSSATLTAGRNGSAQLSDTENFYFNLFPNPVTSSQLIIEYQLEQPHTVAVTLYNMNGRRITVQQPLTRPAGRYTLNANTIAERLWTGVYILEFRIDGKKVTRTIIKL